MSYSATRRPLSRIPCCPYLLYLDFNSATSLEDQHQTSWPFHPNSPASSWPPSAQRPNTPLSSVSGPYLTPLPPTAIDTCRDLDYVCPFSAKMFKTIQHSVRPLIEKRYTNPGVRIIFRQQIQPWHPSSTLTHEAGVAVLRTAPSQFWAF